MEATEDPKVWLGTARRLDVLRGYEAWRMEPSDPDVCDDEGLLRETNLITKLTDGGNTRAMGEYIRTHLFRNYCGSCAPQNFRYYTGTKKVVEDYDEALVNLIRTFSGTNQRPVGCAATTSECDGADQLPSSEYSNAILSYAKSTPRAVMPDNEKFVLLSDAARAYGRSCLMLSGGATLGLYHFGVVRALFEARLLPRVVSGASVGSIVASVICVRTDEELDRLLNVEFPSGNPDLKMAFFGTPENPVQSTMDKLRHLLFYHALMDPINLRDGMKYNSFNLTFLEAFERTGRVLNVAITADRDGPTESLQMICNYISTPNVFIWSAVRCSTAAWGLFPPAHLWQKAPDGSTVPYLKTQYWYDGTFSGDIPKYKISRLFNVNFFIVSQTNPHIAPFFKSPSSSFVHKAPTGWVKRIWFAAAAEMFHWIAKFTHMVSGSFGMIEVLTSAIRQNYLGDETRDVTIMPIGSVWNAIPDYLNIISSPDADDVHYNINVAHRRSMPHMNRIFRNTIIEQTIDVEQEKLIRSLCSKKQIEESPERHSAEELESSAAQTVTPLQRALSLHKWGSVERLANLLDKPTRRNSHSPVGTSPERQEESNAVPQRKPMLTSGRVIPKS